MGIDTAKERKYPQIFINFITMTKGDMIKALRDLMMHVSNAGCCKIVTDADLNYKRTQILKAIEDCYKLEHVCMTFRDVENAFKSWIRSFRKILSKRSLRNLYNLYNELFIKTFALYGGTYGREAYNCA